MTTQAKQQPTDKVLVFVAIVGIVCTIIVSVTANRTINHYQEVGQGGGYEPPLCLCATGTPTPSEVPSLSPANSPTPAPTNTQRPTSTTIARPTETATQTPTQRPTEAFNTPTPEVWSGGVVPTSIDRGGVLFTVVVPAGVVTHTYSNGVFTKRTIALRQGESFTVDTGVTPYCRLDTTINVYRVRDQSGVFVPWKDRIGGFEYTRPDNAAAGKISTEDCV